MQYFKWHIYPCWGYLDKLKCQVEFARIRWIQHGHIGYFIVMRLSPWHLYFLLIWENSKIFNRLFKSVSKLDGELEWIDWEAEGMSINTFLPWHHARAHAHTHIPPLTEHSAYPLAAVSKHFIHGIVEGIWLGALQRQGLLSIFFSIFSALHTEVLSKYWTELNGMFPALKKVRIYWREDHVHIQLEC